MSDLTLNFELLPMKIYGITLWGTTTDIYSLVISELEGTFKSTIKIKEGGTVVLDKYFDSFKEAKIACEKFIKGERN